MITEPLVELMVRRAVLLPVHVRATTVEIPRHFVVQHVTRHVLDCQAVRTRDPLACRCGGFNP